MKKNKTQDVVAKFKSAFFDPQSITAPKPFSLHVIKTRAGKEGAAIQPIVFDLTVGGAAIWIALKIGEGMLQRLGSYIFDIVFPYFKEQQQRELVEMLAARFREILQEEAVRRAGVSLTSLMNKMVDYNNQQGQQIDRLVDATSHAQDLVSELENLGLQGFLAFLVAAGLQLAVIQARFWNPTTRDEGEKTNALRHIRQSSDHVDRMNTAATIALSNRFGPVQYVGPTGAVSGFYYYLFDGNMVWPFPSFTAAKQASDRRYEEELNRLMAEVINPAKMVKAQWRKLARQVPSWDTLLKMPIGPSPSK
jgi:hypothetical protein